MKTHKDRLDQLEIRKQKELWAALSDRPRDTAFFEGFCHGVIAMFIVRHLGRALPESWAFVSPLLGAMCLCALYLLILARRRISGLFRTEPKVAEIFRLASDGKPLDSAVSQPMPVQLLNGAVVALGVFMILPVLFENQDWLHIVSAFVCLMALVYVSPLRSSLRAALVHKHFAVLSKVHTGQRNINNALCQITLCNNNVTNDKAFKKFALKNHPDKAGEDRTTLFREMMDCRDTYKEQKSDWNVDCQETGLAEKEKESQALVIRSEAD